MWTLINRFVPALCTMLFCTLAVVPSVSAEEVIKSFHSDITIRTDGSMTVTETITVRAEGDEIKRGIYRDFPTWYTDSSGWRHHIPFDVRSVRRNGEPEPHFTDSITGGVRLYVGEKSKRISSGEHTYEITYDTDRAIGFFDNHDELYWNVTGHRWSFPIQQASATVTLPEPVPAESLQVDGYTGYEGSKKGAYRITHRGTRRVELETTSSLQKKQGFTIAVGWPKGVVQEPTHLESLYYLVSDHLVLFLGLVALTVVLLYYLWAWARAGADPEQGVIIPRYEPPEGLSPSATRYVMRMGFDDETYAAALVNLAVNGYVRIEEADDGEITVHKKREPDEQVTPGERALMNELFSGGDQIELEQDNHEDIRASREALHEELEDGYHREFFFKNTVYVIVGAVLSLAGLAGAFYAGSSGLSGTLIFFLVWLSVWTVGVVGLLRKTWTSWSRFFRTSGMSNFLTAMGNGAFSLPFIGFWLLPFGMIFEEGGLPHLILIGLFVGVNLLFYVLMKAPTVQGRKLMDKLNGLKRYMRVAEKERLKMDELPERAPELFERLLPYAIALNVSNAWAESFTDVLERASEAEEGYRPAWYHGPSHHTTAISSDLSDSLSSSIATASSPPGSSSGIGGAGGAGGGAGGGGGGGW